MRRYDYPLVPQNRLISETQAVLRALQRILSTDAAPVCGASPTTATPAASPQTGCWPTAKPSQNSQSAAEGSAAMSPLPAGGLREPEMAPQRRPRPCRRLRTRVRGGLRLPLVCCASSALPARAATSPLVGYGDAQPVTTTERRSCLFAIISMGSARLCSLDSAGGLECVEPGVSCTRAPIPMQKSVSAPFLAPMQAARPRAQKGREHGLRAPPRARVAWR